MPPALNSTKQKTDEITM